PLTGVACPMTMATRITTATTGSSDRPGAKIFQIRNLPQDCGPLLLQMAERFGHSAPPFAERIIYARFSGSKKETCRILTFMSHTLRSRDGAERIVDLILWSDLQQCRKIAGTLRRGGNRVGLAAGAGRLHVAVSLPGEEEERLVVPIVDFGHEDRRAHGESVTVVLRDRVLLARFVNEEIGTVQRAVLEVVIQRSVELIVAALGINADDRTQH